uniref:Uncharacterized protein n=1 Tax=Glossina pallidipes TaxID=7398 RepID=A0A1A9ZBF1_GLOPL
MHHEFNCLTCEVKFSTLNDFVKHQLSLNPIRKKEEKDVYCDNCEIRVEKEMWPYHLRKDFHKDNWNKWMDMSATDNPISFTITTPDVDSNSKTVQFNLTLPNDDVLKINISFAMMKVSEALETKDNDYLLRDQGEGTTLTTSTTISPPIETRTTQQEQEKTTEQTPLKYFSVDDAIEAFRRSSINFEIDIGGILEAEKPFYRHFNLKYENGNVPIRCTYKSIYEIRQLKINCSEYREFEQERILSSGEVEKVRTPDLSRSLQNIRIVDLKDYTQMYKMNITYENQRFNAIRDINFHQYS